MKKILLLIMMVFSVSLYSQHTSTGANSDWNNVAAWDQGSVPTASDNVIINHAIRDSSIGVVINPNAYTCINN